MSLAPTVLGTGLGEMTSVRGGNDVLVAQGLGSCVGIAAYEPSQRISVLAHVMLPGPAAGQPSPDQPARYANHAVAALVAEIERRGGRRRSLVVKLAGGAQVIRLAGAEDRLKIGARNIEAVQEALTHHGLWVAAADLGGSVGRTLTLYAATGRTTVRVVGGTERDL